jgi:hypothetical protein
VTPFYMGSGKNSKRVNAAGKKRAGIGGGRSYEQLEGVAQFYKMPQRAGRLSVTLAGVKRGAAGPPVALTSPPPPPLCLYLFF